MAMKAAMDIPNPEHITKFRYRCDHCGNVDSMRILGNSIGCQHCSSEYFLSPNKVILFDTKKTEQSQHFDKLYASGYSSTKDQYISEYQQEYLSSPKRVKDLLKLWGLNKSLLITGKSFLDVACGPGWLTAGLMQNRRIRHSRFHAFDLSSTGLEMLAEFAKGIITSNQLELSVQNAENMRFDHEMFDIIIGHSMLHHLPNYEMFLEDCYRLLKPGGIALFGEPFAIGYGLLSASLKLAQEDLGTNYPEIEGLYNNLAFRITQPRKRLKNMVDKHLFFQSEITLLAQKIGFSAVEFISFLDRDYYRNQFVTDELRLSYKIQDTELKDRANTIYKTIFDLFDSDRFVHAISAFMYIKLSH
jgi:ubiquinone/menaquinone biosynthesis C-methylase UbiE